VGEVLQLEDLIAVDQEARQVAMSWIEACV
jgi:hypothetical protein